MKTEEIRGKLDCNNCDIGCKEEVFLRSCYFLGASKEEMQKYKCKKTNCVAYSMCLIEGICDEVFELQEYELKEVAEWLQKR